MAGASRRVLLAGGAAAIAAAAGAASLFTGAQAPNEGAPTPLLPGARPAHDLIWGANGHPITAYPTVPLEAQFDALQALGLTHYRVNLRGDGSPNDLEYVLRAAAARNITILPILHPDSDLTRTAADDLRSRAFALARAMSTRFRGRVPVWELANELETYAIIQPCERQDDGAQYPCEWGPAGGVGPGEYFGPRWAKVSAVLKGLSEGVAAGDPEARRAIGTAGWGHLGAFERMANDGVAWDITVWHDYPGVSEEFLAILARYGKPIWLTEVNAGAPTGRRRVNARLLAERIAYYRRVGARYRIEAAFFYELLDEPYWGGTFEARMGLYNLARQDGGWRIGARKPAGEAVRAALNAR